MLGRVALVCVLCVIAASNTRSTSSRYTVQNISSNGYPSESHKVTTFDGYILEMHRIPYGRNDVSSTANRPVVFLMHGLMGASSSFVALGPDYSIAYNLADAGFDVWMGNARGNTYSGYHTTLSAEDENQKYSFYDFTFEEIGLYDLPAMIDYALEHTGNQKLHYIGHSQGGTVFLVLTSLRPDYNNKMASVHLLAPAGYQEYFPNEDLKASAENVDLIYSMSLMMGIVELYPDTLTILTPRDGYTIADYCTGDPQQKYMCDLYGVRYLVSQRNDAEIDEDYVPARASVKQIAHYGQNIRDKVFRRYHHGTANNMELYGLAEPPVYNLGLITCDVTLHYTISDVLVDERDILAMAADMPNSRVRKVARDSFQHGDFAAAEDAKELVTDYIIEAMQNTPIENTATDAGNDEVIIVDNTTVAPESVAPEDPVTPEQTDSATTTTLNMYLILFSLSLLFKYY